MEPIKLSTRGIFARPSQTCLIYYIAFTGWVIPTRILTQGGATVQGTMSFTCKTFLVAKFLFFNLDLPNFGVISVHYLKLNVFGFCRFASWKEFPTEAHDNYWNFNTRWHFKKSWFIRKTPAVFARHCWPLGLLVFWIWKRELRTYERGCQKYISNIMPFSGSHIMYSYTMVEL